MKRPWSVAERVLMAWWAMLTAAWCALVLVVAFAYQGGSTTSTWAARLVILLLAAAVTTAIIMLGRRNWLRQIARLLPDRGMNGWIARRPGWVLALFYWAVLGAAEVGPVLWLSHSHHRSPPVSLLALLSGGSAITAAIMALQFRVLRRRQAENNNTGNVGGLSRS